MVDRFVRYAERTARALAGVVDWFCTLNEPNAQVTSKVLQLKPRAIEPKLRADAARAVGSDRFHMYFLGDSYKVRDVCLAAHAKGRDAIKAAVPGAKVGLTLALQELSAGPGGEAPYKRIFAEARAPFYAAAAKDDYIGVQTYNRFETGPDAYAPFPAEGVKDMFGYPTPPGALAAVVREAYPHAKVPVFVTEHGNNTHDDAQQYARIDRRLGRPDGRRCTGARLHRQLRVVVGLYPALRACRGGPQDLCQDAQAKPRGLSRVGAEPPPPPSLGISMAANAPRWAGRRRIDGSCAGAVVSAL